MVPLEDVTRKVDWPNHCNVKLFWAATDTAVEVAAIVANGAAVGTTVEMAALVGAAAVAEGEDVGADGAAIVALAGWAEVGVGAGVAVAQATPIAARTRNEIPNRARIESLCKVATSPSNSKNQTGKIIRQVSQKKKGKSCKQSNLLPLESPSEVGSCQFAWQSCTGGKNGSPQLETPDQRATHIQ